MARRTRRPTPTAEVTRAPISATCPACGDRLYSDYSKFRTRASRAAVTRYARPEELTVSAPALRPVPGPVPTRGRGAPGAPALDVVARVGCLQYTEHRSVPEIHAHLTQLGVAPAERTVANLLDRYDEARRGTGR